jgi:ketosteroid isomerase-like protein
MAEKENVDTLMAVIEGFNRNDMKAAAEGVDPAVTYIIRGRAKVSGIYKGREAMTVALRRIKELTDGTMAGKPEVVLARGDEVMMYMRVTGRRPDGRKYDNHQAYLYRFRNGKLFEGQTIPVDQHAFEEFFAD